MRSRTWRAVRTWRIKQRGKRCCHYITIAVTRQTGYYPARKISLYVAGRCQSDPIFRPPLSVASDCQRRVNCGFTADEEPPSFRRSQFRPSSKHIPTAFQLNSLLPTKPCQLQSTIWTCRTCTNKSSPASATTPLQIIQP